MSALDLDSTCLEMGAGSAVSVGILHAMTVWQPVMSDVGYWRCLTCKVLAGPLCAKAKLVCHTPMLGGVLHYRHVC